jgi:N-acetylneuraminate synthase
MNAVDIGGREIGPGHPCFIVAEAGVNHNGDLGLGLKLVDAARNAGADAVKFQTFRADRLVLPDAPKAPYQTATTGAAESQAEMLRRLELPPEAHHQLMAHCRKRGLLFLSTPFDEGSADFLDELGVPAFKLASGELTYVSFLAHVAAKGKPMIVSTGMATLEEVEAAVRAVRAGGNPGLVLLHCVSAYPADPGDANLRAMRTMEAKFGVPVGFSDHTTGIEVALAAAALGASVIEKHLTVDRSLPGPDHRASVEPQELAQLVRGVRRVQAALGHGRKEPAACEAEIAAVARRSLVSLVEIPQGAVLTAAMVGARRPGTGLPPASLPQVLGRRARMRIAPHTSLRWEMLQ